MVVDFFHVKAENEPPPDVGGRSAIAFKIAFSTPATALQPKQHTSSDPGLVFVLFLRAPVDSLGLVFCSRARARPIGMSFAI
jgi:hypothetical protein